MNSCTSPRSLETKDDVFPIRVDFPAHQPHEKLFVPYFSWARMGIYIRDHNVLYFVPLQSDRCILMFVSWTEASVLDLRLCEPCSFDLCDMIFDFPSWPMIWELSEFWFLSEICDVWFSFCDTGNGNGVEYLFLNAFGLSFGVTCVPSGSY